MLYMVYAIGIYSFRPIGDASQGGEKMQELERLGDRRSKGLSHEPYLGEFDYIGCRYSLEDLRQE